MRTGAVFLASTAWIVLAYPAAACQLPGDHAQPSPVETRKPVHGDDARLTSGFGMRRHPLLLVARMHPGIDWAAPVGTAVIAAGAGRVSFAGPKGEYGNAVLIDHVGGWQTLYTQLSGYDVREGDCVAVGSLIGRVGSTGLSSGPHLHFEVQRDGVAIDPMRVAIKEAPARP